MAGLFGLFDFTKPGKGVDPNEPKKHYFAQGGCLLNYPNMPAKGSDCVCVCKLSYIIQDRGSTEVTATCYLQLWVVIPWIELKFNADTCLDSSCQWANSLDVRPHFQAHSVFGYYY